MPDTAHHLDVSDALQFVDSARAFHRYVCSGGALSFEALVTGFCFAREVDTGSFSRTMMRVLPTFLGEDIAGLHWPLAIARRAPRPDTEVAMIYAALDRARELRFDDVLGIDEATRDALAMHRDGPRHEALALAHDIVLARARETPWLLWCLDARGRRVFEASFHSHAIARRWASGLMGIDDAAWSARPAGTYNATWRDA